MSTFLTVIKLFARMIVCISVHIIHAQIRYLMFVFVSSWKVRELTVRLCLGRWKLSARDVGKSCRQASFGNMIANQPASWVSCSHKIAIWNRGQRAYVSRMRSTFCVPISCALKTRLKLQACMILLRFRVLLTIEACVPMTAYMWIDDALSRQETRRIEFYCQLRQECNHKCLFWWLKNMHLHNLPCPNWWLRFVQTAAKPVAT